MKGIPHTLLILHHLRCKKPWLNTGGTFTLPETNIAPENRPLEKEIPIGNHHF